LVSYISKPPCIHDLFISPVSKVELKQKFWSRGKLTMGTQAKYIRVSLATKKPNQNKPVDWVA
jgi:hypothetical protein